MGRGKYKILVVEDERTVRDILQVILEPEYTVTAAESGEKAVDALGKESFDLIITDMKLPGMSGAAVIKKAKEIDFTMPIIILTGYGTIESAVEAMRKGVYTYLTKPFEKDNLVLNVKRALEYSDLKKENLNLVQEVQRKYSVDTIVGKSNAVINMYEMIKKIADCDATVLICGESGTGKELISKTIHYNSSRRGFPFVPINCGAIPSELLESELFGHEKGAFTGAVATRPGKFERAHRGTIFLDEIGDMPLHLQVKLLRVLQEREIERVGGNKAIQVDVRVIASSNKNLQDAVKDGTFRDDLYYRLNVIPIIIPSLRERRDDIPILVNHFLQTMTRKRKRQIKGISKEAMDTLVNYPWPGNIRELENITERIVILKSDNGPIVAKDLPPEIRGVKKSGEPFTVDIPKHGVNLLRVVEDLEKKFIEEAMNISGGVKNKAAELLGINRTTLVEKLKKNKMLNPGSKDQ